jgi:hypothetical protein
MTTHTAITIVWLFLAVIGFTIAVYGKGRW